MRSVLVDRVAGGGAALSKGDGGAACGTVELGCGAGCCGGAGAPAGPGPDNGTLSGGGSAGTLAGGGACGAGACGAWS
ncbi:MAG: hypothetical protein ACRDUB_11145, partial [Mycobacterium sp.]